ncbi:hypothetical protein KEM52_005233 [Ascosphaera acerosa]|nr:hypothetical protein KEM52_005233 [Ascosphaera acerosa]
MVTMAPIPRKSDFPPQVTLEIVPPPSSSATPSAASAPRSTNVLIILHGLGDSHAPYVSFARALNLPETTCLVLRGPAAMPFGIPGFHWGDDLLLDSSTGLPDADPGFEKSVRTIACAVVIDTLVRKLGYRAREILLLGLGQGGSVACAVALEVERQLASAATAAAAADQADRDAGAGPTSGAAATSTPPPIPESAAHLDRELGGVIAIGAVLPLSATRPNAPYPGKAKTAVLLVGGSGTGASNALADSSGVKRTQQAFGAVEVVRWRDRKGDGMPRNREEMLPLMQFLARRLRSRHGVPEGSVEIS